MLTSLAREDIVHVVVSELALLSSSATKYYSTQALFLLSPVPWSVASSPWVCETGLIFMKADPLLHLSENFSLAFFFLRLSNIHVGTACLCCMLGKHNR